jgi:hypothetical protein
MPLVACLWAVLSGCASDEPPPGDLVPPSLLVGCPAPQDLPRRSLNASEVEILWGRDRSALRRCGSQIDALAEILKGD